MASKVIIIPEVLARVIEAQEKAMEFVRERDYKLDYEGWREFRRLLPKGTKFLSRRTLRLLQHAENYRLWKSQWIMCRLCFAIEQDNNELRRIWAVSLKLAAEAREWSLEPVDLSKIEVRPYVPPRPGPGAPGRAGEGWSYGEAQASQEEEHQGG